MRVDLQLRNGARCLSGRLQAILKDSKLSRNMVNWQDELGWTPLIYAAFKGENRLVKKVSTASHPSPLNLVLQLQSKSASCALQAIEQDTFNDQTREHNNR